jgi:hypothetical protein
MTYSSPSCATTVFIVGDVMIVAVGSSVASLLNMVPGSSYTGVGPAAADMSTGVQATTEECLYDRQPPRC